MFDGLSDRCKEINDLLFVEIIVVDVKVELLQDDADSIEVDLVNDFFIYVFFHPVQNGLIVAIL